MSWSRTSLYLSLGLVFTAPFSPAGAGTPWPEAAEEECPHEYAPIQQVEVGELTPALRDQVAELLAGFSGKSLNRGPVDARAVAAEHPVVLLSIFAEWCCNCGMEAPELVAAARNWRHRGFAIIGRSEYSARVEVRAHMREFGVTWPVLLGSPNPDPANEDRVRTTTAHYRLRSLFGSRRKWGTPYNVLIVDGDFETLYVTDGEYEPGALEAFLEEHLATR